MNNLGSTARLAYKQVGMRFGATTALHNLDLVIEPGEIVGLLGHNGAGKSTLINVTTGAVNATSGTILIDGEPLPRRATPARVADRGITVIHQEPALAGNLSVLDNLTLRRRDRNRRRARRAAAIEALDHVGGGAIPLDVPVGVLSLGERQLVDLARGVLGGEIRALLLDEPTAALGEAETIALHRLIREFAARGTSVVYVSHRLPDILDVCERIVVLRSGGLALDTAASQLSTDALARALAPTLTTEDEWTATPGAETLVLDRPAPMRFRSGEIVGLFGMAGGPQFGILEALYGVGKGTDLAAKLNGRPFAATSPTAALAAGVHLVPADREKDGLVGLLSARDNVFLPWATRHGEHAAIRRVDVPDSYAMVRATFQVLGPAGDSPIASFSGGNRQKHLLGRWMTPRRPNVLLLSQPTQGVDVGAKADIRRAIRAIADAGTTVIVASAESDEIASVCTRAYVIRGDAVAAVNRSAHFDSELLSTLLALTTKASAV